MKNKNVIEAQLDDMMPLMKEVLASGKSVQFMPYGQSMLPMLRPGRDSVILTSLPDELKKYDLVLYQRDNGRYVLHRINIVGENYVCMGDNQFQYEKGIRREQMIGIVSAFFRDEKKYSVQSFWYWLYCRVWPTRRRVRYYSLKCASFLLGKRKAKKEVGK